MQARWRRLWLRLDQRGLYLSLGDAVLLAGESAAFRPTRGYLHPLNHWSFALGACGLAPPQPRNGAWSVANVVANVALCIAAGTIVWLNSPAN